MTTWPICFACLISVATNTHSEHAIIVAYPRQQWLSEWASVLLNTTQPLLHSYKFYWFNSACFIIGHQTADLRLKQKKLNLIQLNLTEHISFILRNLCLLILGYNLNILSSVIIATAEFLSIVLVRYVDIHTIYFVCLSTIIHYSQPSIICRRKIGR